MFDNIFPRRKSKIEKHQNSILITQQSNNKLEINQAMKNAVDDCDSDSNSNVKVDNVKIDNVNAANRTNRFPKHQDSILVTQQSKIMQNDKINKAMNDAVMNTAHK